MNKIFFFVLPCLLLFVAACSRGVEPVEVEPITFQRPPKIVLPEPQLPTFRKVEWLVCNVNYPCLEPEHYENLVWNNQQILGHVNELKATKRAIRTYYEGED